MRAPSAIPADSLIHESGATRGLLYGFLLVMGLMLALAATGIAYLSSMQRAVNVIAEHDEKTRLVYDMYIAARERALQLHAILDESDPFFRDALVPPFYELASQFRGAREKLLTKSLGREERDLLAGHGRLTAQGAALQDEVLDLALADQHDAAKRLLVEQVIPTQNLAMARLRKFLNRQIGHGRAAAAASQKQYRTALVLTLTSGGIALLIAGGVAVVVTRRQSRLLARIRESEQDARILLESIPVGVWFKDADSRIQWVNRAFEQATGIAAANVSGRPEAEVWGIEEAERSARDDREAMATGQTLQRPRQLSSRAGKGGHFILTHTPIPADGGWKGVLCVARDVTTLEQMNDLLMNTNQELQYQKTALDEHAIVSIADTQGRITYVNDKFCAIGGYVREELLGQDHRVVNSGLHPKAFFENLWGTVSAGRVWRGEIRNRRKDGGFYWVDSTIVPFLDSDAVPYQYVSIRTDITARKRLEASLQDSNVNLQRRVDERTAALSNAMEQLEADIAERNLAQEKLKQQYAELQALHQQVQDTQNQLLQSEKLASIGQLAAGVAHEINNPIGFVQSNLNSLDGYLQQVFRFVEACNRLDAALPEDHPQRRELADLRKSLDLAFLIEDIPALMAESRDGVSRVRKIVQDLRDFSRLDASQDWQFADLHQGLDSTLNIVNNEIKYRADVVRQYGDLPPVRCQLPQVNQVFMNLLVNAAHAIEGPRGTITLRTGRNGNDEVWVEVADTGKGIPEEIRNKIFDPFFTTKPVGKGTGLGLSLSYGIVQKHHGRFELESQVGKGSTFRVTLPIDHPDEASAASSIHP